MEHLVQRESGYYFRLMVPPDLKPIFRKHEIKRSLKTGSLSLAKERAFLLSGRLKKLFRQMRYSDDMKLEKHHIDGLIRKYVRETLDQDEEERILNDQTFDPEFHKDHTEILGLAKDLIRTKHAQRDNDFISESVDELLEAEGFTPLPDKKSYEYRRLCHEMFKADAYIWETKRKREQGDYSNDNVDYHPGQAVPEASQVIPQQEPEKQPSGPSLKTLVDQWFHESTKADLWSIRTHQRYAGNFRIMLQILGEDFPIDSVDHGTVRDLKETLFKLPAGMNKKAVFQNKTVPEIIQLNESEVHAETLSINTINAYLTTLGAFFKWCVGNGYMSQNFAEGFKIKTNRNRKRPDEIRQSFTTDQLNQIFKAPEYTEDKAQESYQFWLPILGLYTGARMNELCQLRLKDIQIVDGIPSLVIQDDPEDETVRVKNSASRRTIPLHPFVSHELNFMGHVQKLKDQGETRLFPELPYQNSNYGHKASKWFGRFKKKCGIDSDQLVFHSFRHALSNNLKQQLITETLIDELTGHAIQGETMGRYGKRYEIKVLFEEAVMKLDYTGVDLEHLKESKWAQ
jgi:integrase